MTSGGHAMATREYPLVSPPRARRWLAMVLPMLSKIHVKIYRWTGGGVGARIAGNRILLLTTVGRKTGQSRTTPVTYLPIGEDMTIIGGAAGAARHPGWWLNLLAHPQARVQLGRRTLRVSATRATPEEQERLWARHPAERALFEAMQQRVPRDIPIVVLRPLNAPTGLPPAHPKQAGSTPTETSWGSRTLHRAARGFFSVGSRLLNPLTMKLAGSRSLPMLSV